MPKIQKSRLESMFGSGWQQNLPAGAARSEEIDITDLEARDLIRMANALGTTPEVVRKQLISSGKPVGSTAVQQNFLYTKETMQQLGYRPAQRNKSIAQTSPEVKQVLETINKKLEQQSRGMETKYVARAVEFHPDPLGGHYVIQVGRSYTAKEREINRETGEVVEPGREVFQPRGEPFKLSAIQGKPVIGVVGSSSYYALKHPDLRRHEGNPKDLADHLADYIVNFTRGSGRVTSTTGKGGDLSLIRGLGLTGKSWTNISSRIQYMTPAGRGAELARYSGLSKDKELDPSLRGVVRKGATLPFGSVHMQIPGNIMTSSGKMMLGGEGLSKDTGKRPALHIRDYVPAGIQQGQSRPEAQSNFMWSQQRERESAIPMRGVFFTQQVLPEGQSGVSRRAFKFVTERFEDNPEKFRIPLLAGMNEQDVAKSLGLLDKSNQQKQRTVRPGQKIQAYPGHLGKDIIRNFESAVITGFEIITAQDAEGNYGRYIQLHGHRDTDIGGSAAIKFGGIKALTTSVDPRSMGFSEEAMFNAPSSSRQFMASVLGYMPRPELEKYWARAHRGAKPPELIDTPEAFRMAFKVYGMYLKDNYREHSVSKVVTQNEMERLKANAGNRFMGYSEAGLTTTGEQLYKVSIKTGAYHLPFGAKVVRESSSQTDVHMSHEEGDFYRAMGMSQIWSKVRGEGKGSRAPHEAIAEAVAMNAGKTIKADRPIYDIDDLARNADFKKRWRETLEAKRKEFTPADFKEQLAGMSSRNQAYQTSILEDAIVSHAMDEMFGGNALFKVGGQHIAGPGLLRRFAFIDEATNKEVGRLRGATQGVIADALGGQNLKGLQDVIKRQAGLLEGGGIDAWLGARTRRGIEGTYASLDELGTNEAASSYKALSDMFGLHELGIDWRTTKGRKAIDDLSRQQQLLETGMRNPTSNPRQTAGLVRNFITENILRERGLGLSLGTSRTIYNNPSWVWSQGGDNDSDRLRSFAMTLFKKGQMPESILQLSSIEDILKAARENPAGEQQDYEKKLKKGTRSKFFNVGTMKDAYDPVDVQNKTTKVAELLSEQTGAVYNIFRRILPALAEAAHPGQQGLIGLASARYFQPLIDQKEYPSGSPEAELVTFLGSYQGFRGSYQRSEKQDGKTRYGRAKNEEEAFSHFVENILGKLYNPKDNKRNDPLIAQMVASMIASPSRKGSGRELAKLLMEGKFNAQSVSRVMGGSLVSSEDSPISQLMRGMGHANALGDIDHFQKLIENAKMGQGQINLYQVTDYASRIDNNRNQLPKELQDEWRGIVGDHYGNVYKNIIEPNKGNSGTILAMLPPDKLGAFLKKAINHFSVMKKSRKDFELLKDIMGPVASKGSMLHQSTEEIIGSKRQAALGTVPEEAHYTAAEMRAIRNAELTEEFMRKARPMAEGGIVDEPTHALVGERGEREYVVPESKTTQVGRARVFDPASLGTKGGYAMGEGMGKRSVVRPGGWAGGGGRSPEDWSSPVESPEPARREITTYSQPFTEKLAQQYELLAEKLHRYADTVEDLNLSGATLADVSGQLTPIIKAAGQTFHQVEGQYSRSIRTLRFAELEEKSSASMRAKSPGPMLEDEEFRELATLRAQMSKPTGAEIGLAGRVKGAIQEIFPAYAEREAKGFRGTRLPAGPLSRSPLAQAAAIAGRDPSLVQEGVQVQRRALALQQHQERYGMAMSMQDVQELLGPYKGRRAITEGLATRQPGFTEAARAKSILTEAQPLQARWLQMHREFTGAEPKRQQQLAPMMNELADQVGDLRDEFKELTPVIKQNRENIREQAADYRESAKDHKQLISLTGGELREVRKQLTTPGMPIQERAALQSRQQELAGRLKGQAGRYRDDLLEAASLKEQEQFMRMPAFGVGAKAVKAAPTRMQMAGKELAQGYDPQRLFYQFQNMQQLQYMAFAPMLGMRDQYLGQQQAIGQAQYALGAGQMPTSVLQNQVSQANVSRAMTNVGKGVDQSAAMRMFYGATDMLAENKEAGSSLGSTGFNVLSGLTALGLGKMAFGPLAKAGGKLFGGIGAVTKVPMTAAPGMAGTWTSGGFAPAATAVGGAGGLTALGLAGAAGGGLLAGGVGYEALRQGGYAQPGSASLGQIATTAAYGLGKYMPESIEDMMPWKGGMVGKWWRGEGNQERGEAWGQAVGGMTGAVASPTDDGIPVWIKKIDAGVQKELAKIGVKGGSPFTDEDYAQMGLAYAQMQGIREEDITSNPEVLNKIIKDLTESAKSGVSAMQSIEIQQKAISASGYAPGTRQAQVAADWANQGSLFQRQQRLEAVGIAQQAAGFMGMEPEQEQQLRERVSGMRAGGASEFQMRRYQSQLTMGTPYDWSAAAYQSGNPQMALMDQAEPWRPKYQREQWAIEDRRRQEDIGRELGGVALGAGGFEFQGGRQQQELTWQRQKLDLEQEFWDFRRNAQDEDFQIQQKLFDFNIKQMRFSMDREDRQAQMQIRHQEQQYEISKKIFDLQTKYKRQDFDKQEMRMETQRGWQVQDQAWNRESFELQAGWQQEDLERALRYSSGRERMDIRRQMERAGIMADRQRTEFDRTEERSGVQYDWAQEDLATARARFEEMRVLQEQQMELGRQYWEEQKQFQEEDWAARRAMMEEQIGLMQEQNAINVGQYEEQRALAEQQHELERAINEEKLIWSTEDLARARERAAEDEKMLNWQREMVTAQEQYSAFSQMGYEWLVKSVPEMRAMAQAAQELADNMAQSGGSNGPSRQPTPSSRPGAINQGFAYGGPVSRTGPATVHEGEFVVPSAGALVIRSSGDGEKDQLLREIRDLLEAGGGKILIDRDQLQADGFVHVNAFTETYH